jgi:hypothetical protein
MTFSAAYVEACRVARLRRTLAGFGQDAVRLRLGDSYAWREGVPGGDGGIRVSCIDSPRPMRISDDRIWWVPSLDQLLERLEVLVIRELGIDRRKARECIARWLAEATQGRDWSSEEAALALLMEAR